MTMRYLLMILNPFYWFDFLWPEKIQCDNWSYACICKHDTIIIVGESHLYIMHHRISGRHCTRLLNSIPLKSLKY